MKGVLVPHYIPAELSCSIHCDGGGKAPKSRFGQGFRATNTTIVPCVLSCVKTSLLIIEFPRRQRILKLQPVRKTSLA